MVQAKISYAAGYHFGPRWGTLISVFNVQDTEDALQDINYVPEFSEERIALIPSNSQRFICRDRLNARATYLKFPDAERETWTKLAKACWEEWSKATPFGRKDE